MLGITIFTGAMPDGERLPGLPSRYEAFRLVMKRWTGTYWVIPTRCTSIWVLPTACIRSNMRDAARKRARLRERHPHGDMLMLNQNGHLLTDKDFE